MKNTHILLVALLVALLAGPVMAANTVQIDATVPPTITATAIGDIPVPWALVKGVNNKVPSSPTLIFTATSDVPAVATITVTNGGKLFSASRGIALTNPLHVTGSGWDVDLTGSQVMATMDGNTGASKTFDLFQNVLLTDKSANDYQAVLTLEVVAV